MQFCDATCGWCARNWFNWLKSREAQMSVPTKDKVMPNGHVRKGCSVPFSEAARTSVRPDKEYLKMCDQVAMGNSVVRARSDGNGYRFAPEWLPVYQTFRLTAFGVVRSGVYPWTVVRNTITDALGKKDK